MVAFGNPVEGIIRPPGSPLIVGSFRVTSTYADHVVSGRGPGIDIGNGRCGDPILAMADGKVSLAGLVGDAKVVRVLHPQFPGYETGAAHLDTIEVKVGQLVTRGQRIGTLGTTGATACHLHQGCKVNGVEIDWWPLLIQNGAVEDDVLQGANPKRIVNRKTTVKADDTNFRSSPFVRADNKIAQFDAGALVYPDWSVEGTTVGTSKVWYGFWGLVAVGRQEYGYMHESVLNALTPIEQSGHTDAELAAARKNGAHTGAVAVSNAALAESLKYPA
jgi:hypothetical protein